LQEVINIGAPLVGPQSERFHEATGAVVRGGFGCNENPIISSTFAAAGFETKSCDVQERLLFDNDGMPAPFVERRALDASGVEIPHDGQAIGELVYRSPITIDGYYHNDAATSRAFRDGWYFSGNMVTVAPDGRVNITERIEIWWLPRQDMFLQGKSKRH
jgi:fatty-acyl-CoA synthase